MINGTVLAPFRHDSTWPGEELTLFRHAVYYFHVHVPGRDSVTILKELARKKSATDSRWRYLKDASDKVAHLAVRGVNDEEMCNLAKNLLIFANVLVVEEYGLEAPVSVRCEGTNEEKNKEDEAGVEAARRKFAESINDAYESLESAIDGMKQKGKGAKGRQRGSLRLGKTRVLSPVPSTHHFRRGDDDFRIVLRLPNADACGYTFHPHDPIGWVMESGKRSDDRFADDVTSSMGVWSKKSDGH